MINIFVEASCNRYVRDECTFCHVYEPLNKIEKSDWHLTPEQASSMVEKINQMDLFKQLAEREINLTGGEPSQNPHIVEVFKIFKSLTPNIRLHTNLDINSPKDKRWQRLIEIMQLNGKIDFTLYPTVWEEKQKTLLEDILKNQNELIVNVIFETVASLLDQVNLLIRFFEEQDSRFKFIIPFLNKYKDRLEILVKTNPECSLEEFENQLQGTESFITANNFLFGINMILGFTMDDQGHRAMTSQPFPKDINVLECTIPRGTIEIITVQQTGEITPCCDVGNLKCQPKFGNLLKDTPGEIMKQIEISRAKMVSGAEKNKRNIEAGKPGEPVEEGIPPFCI